jgi:hypothetical protein
VAPAIRNRSRASLHSDVVSLYYLQQFCNLGLGDPFSSCNKRIVFMSYPFLLGKTYGRNDLKLLLDYRASPDDRQVT